MKILGFALIFFCFCGAGAYASDKQRTSLRVQDAFYDFLCFIKMNIEQRAIPLADIYASFYSDVLEKCGFHKALKMSKDANPLFFALCNSDAKVYTGAGFELLCEFSKNIGKCANVEGEIKLCERYIAEYERIKNEESGKRLQLIPLYSRLGIIGGLFVCAVLM